MRVSVSRNEVIDDKALIRRYLREIAELKQQVALLTSASAALSGGGALGISVTIKCILFRQKRSPLSAITWHNRTRCLGAPSFDSDLMVLRVLGF